MLLLSGDAGLVLLILALIAATPNASAPSEATSSVASDPIVETNWSLKKPIAKGKVVIRRRAAPQPVRQVRRQEQPRIYGGASVGNAHRNGTRGGANVGVALPF